MKKDKKTEESKKARSGFNTFLNIFLPAISVVMICVTAVVFYQRVYLTPFWVNGQSMYPTFNSDAKDANGRILGDTDGESRVGYTVDYGVMNSHKSAIKKLKRFDIIVTKYKDSDTTNKIKRIVGLPGETIKFTVTGTNNPSNGDLYINGEYVEQPIKSEYIAAGTNYPTVEITLGDDEYYVLGDNRGHSADSRTNGPVKKDWISGKVVAICGTCEVYKTESGTLDIKNIKYSKWPRFLK